MAKLEKEMTRFHDNCAKIQEMQYETLRITEILVHAY